MSNNPLLINTNTPAPGKRVRVDLPLKSLQAVYDLIALIGAGEFEARLETYTTCTEAEIRDAAFWLDTFFKYLDNQGMRVPKFRRDMLRLVKEAVREDKTMDQHFSVGA